MSKKQSSIEWLLNWMEKNQYFIGNDLLHAVEQAKAMHKEEIIDTFFEGAYGGDIISGEQYYNKTFGRQDE